MLERCAPGYTRVETVHHWRVGYQGRTYATLPLGAHGRRRNAEVKIGHVKQMVRMLQIEPCAKSQLEQLR